MVNLIKKYQETTTPPQFTKKQIRDLVWQVKQFYASKDWQRTCGDVRRFRKCCESCGWKSGDGVKLRVEHIKPIHTHWQLRFDPKNTKVLCQHCKG